MGKNTIFKGILHGTATSYILSGSFVMQVDKDIEGLPEEIVVYAIKLHPMGKGGFGMSGRKSLATHIRPGDLVIVEGEIVQEFEGREQLEFIRMKAEHVYNETLKCGF